MRAMPSQPWPSSSRTIASLASLLLLAVGSVAAAQPDPAQADRALATFTPAELALLEPLLANGTVSLVEFATAQTVPAVVIATEVDAPASVVADVISDPRRYPDFMPALDEVHLEAETADGLSYSWEWRTAIFTLRGTQAMQRYAPPPDHPEIGWRFVVRSTGGDLGAGRSVWRVLPRGDRTLLITSSRMDLRDANYLARQLAAAGTSMNRTVNVSINFAMILRTRVEAERRAGRTRTPLVIAAGEPERPTVDARALGPLLGRGDLTWVETTGTDLGRVAVIGRVHTDVETTRAAMLDPEGFTASLVAGSSATVVDREGTTTRFRWGLDLPLVGTSGQMRLGEQEPGGRMFLDGEEGALSHARWRFETLASGAAGTTVVSWGRFDPADGLWLLRVVSEADAAFRPGLATATQLMMIRGLRHRLLTPQRPTPTPAPQQASR